MVKEECKTERLFNVMLWRRVNGLKERTSALKYLSEVIIKVLFDSCTNFEDKIFIRRVEM